MVIVPLAPGFEEIEAITIIDVLRRAGLDVRVAALSEAQVEGAHGVRLLADTLIAQIDPAQVTLLVLPGGMPGAQHLHDHAGVQALVTAVSARGAWVGAICAAPMALTPSGLAAKHATTCYPGFEDRVASREHRDDRVVVDGKLVTSRGPGTAMDFALALVELVVDTPTAAGLRRALLA